MPGRTYSATGTEPSSLIIPWGGINGYSGGELLTNCADNFTIELWVKTGGETHEIDQLYATGGGTSGQRYVIDPPQGLYYNNSYDDAGVGISVGTNGVSIYEHNYGYMPAVLIWEGTITDWTHIALVYENKIPRLYINGNLVGTGTASPKTHVYPGTLLGSGVFGTMNGWIDEARIWNTVRSQQQIQENMNKSVATPQSNLEAYWPIQTGEITNLQDISGNNHTVVLPPGNNYGSYTNDGSSTAPLSGDYYYRYGFNGKENDNEVKGTGNQQDYGMRIYDPRLGRFLSVDPLTSKYAMLTPYQFASNTPIQAVDLDGKEAWIVVKTTFKNKTAIQMVFDENLKNPGGVYFIHRYQSPDNVFFTESEVSGVQNYSEYRETFPNFSTGEFKPFSVGEIASSFRIRGDANVLFGEVALKANALGAELGGSFGVEGKLIGLNVDTDDRRAINSEQNRGGLSLIGWNSTFRESDQSLNVGGDASLLVGLGYRQKFDLNSASFVKENEIKYNGIFTSGSVNSYTGETTLSWGVGGKAALGVGVNGEINLSLNLNKLGEALRKLSLSFTPEEKKQMSAKQGGNKEFNPNDY